jgi:hypothetical protein|eukprot:COSAG01_NODE_2662_length_7295_cov_5.483324_4_plen_86_part_00
MYVRARTRHLSIYLSISSTATCLDAEVAALVIQRYERGRVARAAMRWRERWRAQQRGSQAAAKLKREQDARQEDWLASTAHHPKR